MHPAAHVAVVALLLLGGCAAIGPDETSSPTSTDTTTDLATEVERSATDGRVTTTESKGATRPVADEPADGCGNALGNGDEIVPGPATAEETGDNDNPFHSLAVHPTDPDALLVGTERNGFVRTTDGGETWTRFRYGLRHRGEGYPEIYDIAYAGADPDVLYAATTMGGPGPLVGDLPSAGGGVYKSTDGGESWSRRNCGIEDNGGRTTSVWVDPSDSAHAVITVSGGPVSFHGAGVEAGTFVEGGIYYTEDGGDRWVAADGPDELARTDFVTLASDGDALYASARVGLDWPGTASLFRSSDGGRSWDRIELPVDGTADAVTAGDGVVNVIVGTSTGGVILRSEDRGDSWDTHELRSSGYTVASAPGSPETALYGTVSGFHRSADGLRSAQSVLDVPSSTHPSDVAFAPSDPDRVYAITQGYRLYRSDDGGATFRLLVDLRDDVLNSG